MGALDLVTWWPVDAAAAGVARRTDAGGGSSGGIVAAVVDGVGNTERPFAWASLTKMLVAMAVFVAAEEGTVSLDEPVGPPGSTVRHLLAHASGLGPDSAVPVAGPGRMRIYSNIGYEMLAETLAERTQMAFTDYLTGAVIAPLHMTGTALLPDSSPASGAEGPLHDLLTLATELLAPSLVSPATMAEATSVAFPGLRGVLPGYGRFDPCDWGLGFEVKGDKVPHWTGSRTSRATFGHFGRAGGFLWVDSTTGLACASLSNRDFGPWAADEWATLADAVVDEWTTVQVIEAAVPSRRERIAVETEQRARDAAQARAEADADEAERRAEEAARAQAEADAAEARAQAEAAEAEWRAQDAERQAQEVARAQADAEAAEAEWRAQEVARAQADAEAAEAEWRAQEVARAQADAEAAEAEWRAQEVARADADADAAADAQRRAYEAAQAEAVAAEAEWRAQEAARAQTEAAEAEWRAHEVAQAQADADEAERRRVAEAESAEAEQRRRNAAEAERRVAAMTERRQTAVTRISDVEGATAGDHEEVGSLGPGIRPVDFWGASG